MYLKENKKTAEATKQTEAPKSKDIKSKNTGKVKACLPGKITHASKSTTKKFASNQMALPVNPALRKIKKTQTKTLIALNNINII